VDNIIDVNFNFDLFDKNITEILNSYNISKDNFCKGLEVSDVVIDKGKRVLELLCFYIEVVNYRLRLIEEEFMDDKFHNKQKLRKERVRLLKKVDWYEKVVDSIEEECEHIRNGTFNIDEENDLE